jgi:hypothetical protein
VWRWAWAVQPGPLELVRGEGASHPQGSSSQGALKQKSAKSDVYLPGSR